MHQISSGIKTAFFTILFLFFGLLLYTKIFGPIPFSVNSITTQKTDLFTVSGEGEASAVPETAKVSLGLIKNGTTVAAAKEQVNQVSSAIIAELKKMGVEEKNIKTTNYSVNPNYNYENGRNDINGYVVSQTLEIEIKPIDLANQVIDMAADKGANQIGNVQFVLDDAKRMELEQEARSQAIQKAKAKAQNIASTAGISLGKIVNVQENSFGTPEPRFMKLDIAAGGNAESQTTELQAGENTVRINVTLAYETF